MVIVLSRTEKEALHGVLRRALERVERARRAGEAEQLAIEIAALDYELRMETPPRCDVGGNSMCSQWDDCEDHPFDRQPGKVAK